MGFIAAYDYFDVEYKAIAQINSERYAELVISNNTLLRNLKNKIVEINLPVMKRKWDRINAELVLRYVITKKGKKNANKLHKEGCSMNEIFNILSIPYGTIYSHIKERR